MRSTLYLVWLVSLTAAFTSISVVAGAVAAEPKREPFRIALIDIKASEDLPLPDPAQLRTRARELAAAQADVVILKVNIQGGLVAGTPELRKQVEKLIDLFEHDYARRFRIVTWVESAVGTPALSIWGITEMYMMPHANLGAFIPHGEHLQALPAEELEAWHELAETASRHAGRDPKIVRPMISDAPLSADVGADEIRWRQDEDGEHVLNRKRFVLTLGAPVADRFKLIQGVAAQPADLLAALGYKDQRIEWLTDEEG